MSENEYWFCLTHHAVEGHDGCKNADRLGPYPDSVAWCAALLEAEDVAVTPGPDFDTVDGGTAIRLSLAAGPEAIGAALLRIRRFQQAIG